MLVFARWRFTPALTDVALQQMHILGKVHGHALCTVQNGDAIITKKWGITSVVGVERTCIIIYERGLCQIGT